MGVCAQLQSILALPAYGSTPHIATLLGSLQCPDSLLPAPSQPSQHVGRGSLCPEAERCQLSSWLQSKARFLSCKVHGPPLPGWHLVSSPLHSGTPPSLSTEPLQKSPVCMVLGVRPCLLPLSQGLWVQCAPEQFLHRNLAPSLLSAEELLRLGWDKQAFPEPLV